MRRSPLRPQSPKRAAEQRIYLKRRAVFLAEHTLCEFPLGCTEPATEIQHRRGRRGARLLQVEWWAGSCHFHNGWAETNTGEALACGWLVRIESVA